MSSRLVAFLLLLAAPAIIQGAASFKNEHFLIELDSDWERIPLRFVDHVAFISKERNVSLKMDSAPAPLRRHTPHEAARGLLEMGIRREQEENKGGSVTITGQSIRPIADGVVAEYSGRDGRRRSFKWVGLIRNHKFVYLYFETPSEREKHLEGVVQAVLEKLRVLP